MKQNLPRITVCLVAGILALAAGQTAGRAAQDKPAAPTTNSIPVFEAQPLPQSVFAIPANPKQGRNPFFPESALVIPQPARTNDTRVDTSIFVLNGITPSGPRRTAMINGHTFEAGESNEVRTTSGNKVMVKCDEIRTDSVIITVDGQRRELKLRLGL
jgi:hypothetical protein